MHRAKSGEIYTYNHRTGARCIASSFEAFVEMPNIVVARVNRLCEDDADPSGAELTLIRREIATAVNSDDDPDPDPDIRHALELGGM